MKLADARKKEYGDFQTPMDLAEAAVRVVADNYGAFSVVVEPTCGVGNFIEAARRARGDRAQYVGYEINEEYCERAAQRFAHSSTVRIEQADFFQVDWKRELRAFSRPLILGNPPWVTNSAMGASGGSNLPPKSNRDRLKGIDAITGKANFDVAEWMILELFDAAPEGSVVAMVCKAASARKVLKGLWPRNAVSDAALYATDAKKHFDADVDACLFVGVKSKSDDTTARLFDSFDDTSPGKKIGVVNNRFVSDVELYREVGAFDGVSPKSWRSGIKHDAAKIMELTRRDDAYINGLGERADVEKEVVFPLLKSSDLANNRSTSSKWVVLPQRRPGEETASLSRRAPLLWRYLTKHAVALDARKSSIYRKRRFSIFGVGEYSFATWKVAISSLHKRFNFVVVGPQESKPTMVDDASYFLPCRSEEEATFLAALLDSEPARRFFQSIVFRDAKRTATSEILNRLDLEKIANALGRASDFRRHFPPLNEDNARQLSLEFNESRVQ
jgi:hypothetical protein